LFFQKKKKKKQIFLYWIITLSSLPHPPSQPYILCVYIIDVMAYNKTDVNKQCQIRNGNFFFHPPIRPYFCLSFVLLTHTHTHEEKERDDGR
jgi:hypothetical protein